MVRNNRSAMQNSPAGNCRAFFYKFFASTCHRKTNINKHATRMDKPNYPTDGEISLALASGDGKKTWAIEQIDYKYRSRLYSVAARILGSTHDAEDAVQEAMVAIFKKETWDVAKPLEGYLVSTVHNKSVNIVRERMGQKKLGDALQGEQEVTATSPPDIVLEEIISNEKRVEGNATFDEFVSSLKGKQRKVAEILNEYSLQHGRRPTMKEIADEMKKGGDTEANEGAVKSIMRELKGKMKLRK